MASLISKCLASAGLMVCLISPTALAASQTSALQDEARIEADQGILSYSVDFFASYNPQTALGMVRRVPGFSIADDNESRGLSGNLSNVLINGTRPSAKQGVSNLLSRIPAASVQSVELIISPQPGLEMAGYNQLINIVTDQNGAITGNWSATVRVFEDGHVTPAGQITMTRADERNTLTLGLQYHTWYWRGIAQRSLLNSDLQLTGQVYNPRQRKYYEIAPTLSWERNFDAGHTLRVDARSEHWNNGFNHFNLQSDSQGVVEQGLAGDGGYDGHNGEITVDFDYAINPQWTSKFTGFQRLAFEDGAEIWTTLDPQGTETDRTEIINDRENTGESIARNELRYQRNNQHATTLATEIAYNFLDQALEIFSGLDRTPDDLPVATTKVEELRFDTTLTHVWRPTSQWSFDGILGFETSRITQSGDAEQERDLSYFKPGLIARWTPNDVNQFTLTLRRDVSQLDFGEFASSVNVTDDTQNLGNPDLEPQRTTQLKAEWQRRFNGEGSFSIRARHEWVEAVSGLVPLSATSEGPGNLGDGTRTIVSAELTTPLDKFGVSGGLLTLEARVRETQVDDAITGESRRFRGQNDWRSYVDFRQDLPQKNFAWGFDYALGGSEDFFRINQFSRFTPAKGDLDLFIERRIRNTLTARLGADLNLGTNTLKRYFWDETRAIRSPTSIEQRQTDRKGVVYFRLEGSF